MLRSLSNVGPRPLALSLLLVLGGCNPTVEVLDDAAACAGVRCTAGQCFSNAGQPMCRCGDWEERAGVPCAVAVFEHEDDHGGSPWDATVLPLGTPLVGHISGTWRGLLDRDLFTFTASEHHSYVFTCEGQGQGFSALPDCHPRLLDATGRQVAGVALNTYPEKSWLFSALPEGTWFIEVHGAGRSGTYRSQLKDLGWDDHADLWERASELSPGAKRVTVATTFRDDRDVLAFRTQERHGYRVTCQPQGGDPRVRLVDSLNRVVDFADGRNGAEGTPRVVTLKADVESTAFLEVGSASGNGLGTLTCELEDLGRDDHGDTQADATPLRPGVPVSIVAHTRHDPDLLTFDAKAGHHYAVRREPADLGTIQVLTSSGAGMFWGNSLEYGFQASTPGPYFLHVTRPWTDDPLQLTLVDLGPDDHGDIVERATPAPLGTPVEARSHSGTDVDAISFPVEEDGVYAVTSAPECFASAYAPSLGQLFWTQSVPFKQFDSRASESVTLLVAPSRPIEPCTLMLERVGTDDHGDTLEAATSLRMPVAASGGFEADNDVDAFSIVLEAGRTYRVETPPEVSVMAQLPGFWYRTVTDSRFTAPVSGPITFLLKPVGEPRVGPWSLRVYPE